nr:reverse transcriptase domain-containing protein [Tanacetum cinerariifolium]
MHVDNHIKIKANGVTYNVELSHVRIGGEGSLYEYKIDDASWETIEDELRLQHGMIAVFTKKRSDKLWLTALYEDGRASTVVKFHGAITLRPIQPELMYYVADDRMKHRCQWLWHRDRFGEQFDTFYKEFALIQEKERLAIPFGFQDNHSMHMYSKALMKHEGHEELMTMKMDFHSENPDRTNHDVTGNWKLFAEKSCFALPKFTSGQTIPADLLPNLKDLVNVVGLEAGTISVLTKNRENQMWLEAFNNDGTMITDVVFKGAATLRMEQLLTHSEKRTGYRWMRSGNGGFPLKIVAKIRDEMCGTLFYLCAVLWDVEKAPHLSDEDESSSSSQNDDGSKTRKYPSFTSRIPNYLTRTGYICHILLVVIIIIIMIISSVLIKSGDMICVSEISSFDRVSRARYFGLEGVEDDFGALGVPWCKLLIRSGLV